MHQRAFCLILWDALKKEKAMEKNANHRILVSVLTFIAVLLLAVSCSPDANNNGEGENMTIYVPSFEGGSTSRGLTDMFNDATYFVPFDSTTPEGMAKNLYLSYGVMTTTPITPSIRAVSNVQLTASSVDKLKLKLGFESYGFKVEVDDLEYDFLGRKIMIKYNIKEENEVVGVVDYVYDWLNMTFSYRERVMLTLFGESVPVKSAYTFAVLVIEMHDVKLNIDGSFTTGEMVDGKLKRNAWVDFIQLMNTSYYGNNNFEYCIDMERNYLTISSKGGKLFSMAQPSSGLKYRQSLLSIDQDSLVYKKLVESNFLKLQTPEAVAALDLDHYNWGDDDRSAFFDFSVVKNSDFGMDFLQAVADLTYTNSSILKKTGVSDLSEGLEFRSGATSQYQSEMFTAYDVNRKTGASLQLLGTKELRAILNNDWYEFCNFRAFDSNIYRKHEDSPTMKAIRDGLIEDHLKACGISDANYIENYKTAKYYASIYKFEESDMGLLEVTTENPELFREKLEKAVAQQKAAYLIAEFKNYWPCCFTIADNGSGSCGSSFGIGPFIKFSHEIEYETEKQKIKQIAVLSGKDNHIENLVISLSIPENITSVAEGVITKEKFPSLERIEVSKDFDITNLPEELVVYYD